MQKKSFMDSIQLKEFNPKEKSSDTMVTSEKIFYRLVFGRAPEDMLTPLAYIIKMNKLKIVFTPVGIMGERKDFDKMINILYNSVRYN